MTGRKHWECIVLRPGDLTRALRAAMEGDQKALAAGECAIRWFEGMNTQTDVRFLCLSCETQFTETSPPHALLLALPMFEGTTAVVTGICTCCYETNERMLNDYILDSMRRYWPSIDAVQIGQA